MIRFKKLTFGIVIIALLFALTLSACGQKGPLVLPEEPADQLVKKNS